MTMDSIEVNGITYEYETVREWKNLKVVEIDLPGKPKGVSCPWNEPGEYRIFIDRTLNEQEKLRVFIHEMIHLYHRDHESGEDVVEIEARTDRETEAILQEIG